MNLTVSRDRLFEQPDGTWWFVVEGEHASDYIDRTNVVNPPADLVALAARCTLCDGDGFVFGPGDLCPDCADRTLTIGTECECACHRLPSVKIQAECRCFVRMEARSGFESWSETADTHALVRTYGTVWLGPFRIGTPVPIVGADDADLTIEDERPCVHLGDTHDGPQWFYFDGDDVTPITLGPDPTRFVGQFAVKAVPA